MNEISSEFHYEFREQRSIFGDGLERKRDESIIISGFLRMQCCEYGSCVPNGEFNGLNFILLFFWHSFHFIHRTFSFAHGKQQSPVGWYTTTYGKGDEMIINNKLCGFVTFNLKYSNLMLGARSCSFPFTQTKWTVTECSTHYGEKYD